jgi:hypothetical protein
MTRPNTLIALMVFFVLAQILCNWVEDNPLVYNASPNILVGSDDKTIPIDIQAPLTFVNRIINFCGDLFLFDYSVFKDVDPVTGVATDNDFVIFRYILICFGVVMWTDVLLTARRLIFGG